MIEWLVVTGLISASFSTGWENYYFLQGEEHPNPLSLPGVGRRPGTLHHINRKFETQR